MALVLWNQDVDVMCSDKHVVGEPITLPIAPFPGLKVGALVVQSVAVCQGDDLTHYIEYEPIDMEHARMLVEQGWRIETYDEMACEP